MITAESLNTAAYGEFEVGTMELHDLIRKGEDDTPVAAEIRNWLYGPWDQMTAEQQAFGNGLSGDLYMLNPTDGEVYEPASDEERSPQRLGLAIKAAWDRRECATVLDLLRKGTPFFQPDWVAFLRARCYDELGRVHVALAFARHAGQLAPNDTTYRTLELNLLVRSGQADAAASLAWKWVDEATFHPILVVAGANELFLASRQQDDAAARPTLEKLSRALGDTIERLAKSSGEPAAAERLPYAHLLLGGCRDRLGDLAAAQRSYESAIALTADDADGRVFRGSLGNYVVQRFLAEDRATAAPSQVPNRSPGEPADRSIVFNLTEEYKPHVAA